jgi:DNA processing protein
VECAAEIVELLAPAARSLGLELAARLGGEEVGTVTTATAADADYRRLLSALGHEPATMDELVQRTELSAAALSSMLLMLELDGRIERRSGNAYQVMPTSLRA